MNAQPDPNAGRRRKLTSSLAFGVVAGLFLTAPLVAFIGNFPPVVLATIVVGGIMTSAAAQAYARQRALGDGQKLRWWELHALPLATPRERSLQRMIRINLGVIVVAVSAMLVSVAFFHHPAGAIAGVPIIWVCVMVMLTITTKVSAAHYQALQELRRSGYRVCPGCTYDLASLPPGPGVCPECGRPFDEATLKERWEAIYEVLQKKPGP